MKDSNGRVVMESYEERVNTHYARREMIIQKWYDDSPPSSTLRYLEVFLASRLYTEMHIDLTHQAQKSYEHQKAEFIRYEHRDRHYDYKFTKTIPFHPEHCLLYNP